MLLHIRKYLASERGAIAPMAAMLFLTMMGFVALGVDVGDWMMQKRHLQTAVDAAALAGAYELANGQTETDAEAAALKEAEKNGYVESSDPNTKPNFTYNADGNGVGIPTFEVDITQQQASWFSSLIPNAQNQVNIKTAATAEVEALDGVYCMLTLGNVPDAITTSGNVTMDAQGCGMTVNSTSNQSLYLNGNVTVNVGDVHLMGSYQTTGNVSFSYNSMRQNASQTVDPYASLGIEDTNLATEPCQNASSNPLQPGRYCGGLSLSGGNITMAPGTYYIDNGNFDLSGNGSVTGDGVTIVMTSTTGSNYGTINEHGSTTLSLTAPTTGYYAGVAIYQDRNTPSGCTESISGNVAMDVNGIIYAPTCNVTYGGNGSVDPVANICTKIISDTITFHGTPAIGSNCDNSGGKKIGAPAVKLIL